MHDLPAGIAAGCAQFRSRTGFTEQFAAIRRFLPWRPEADRRGASSGQRPAPCQGCTAFCSLLSQAAGEDIPHPARSKHDGFRQVIQ